MEAGGEDGCPQWAHDYPRAERNFMNILRETTLLQPYMHGGNIFKTDDPKLTRFPLAYISEPGYWNPTESEVEGLRNYLLKGGFLIADDFRGSDWFNFDAQMKRVIPSAEFVELDETHMIFDSFFRIESLKTLISPTFQVVPVYLGLHEENDPDRRLMAIANYNNDIGEYWESKLTRFPLAYISEPGYWNPTESEVEGLRNYLLKGGFLIADDFRGSDWFNFDAQMKRVIPGAEFVELDETHTIFDSFFRIESLKTLTSPTFRVVPAYLGLHEENDPDRRLVAIANYNNDIGEYWEFSDVGWYPIDLSNEAYKLGVNYVIYAMTH